MNNKLFINNQRPAAESAAIAIKRKKIIKHFIAFKH